ncbi:MAG: hypothetical protein ACPGFA_12215 [Pikeienuella sp.]
MRVAIAAIFNVIASFPFSPLFAQSAVDDSYLGKWTPMVGLSVASQHFGAERDFNETNPGLLIGAARPSHYFNAEFGVEGGVFKNSFDDTSYTIGGWYEWPLLGEPDATLGQLRLGFAFGYAKYPELVERADAVRALTIGNFVPYLTPQATWRITESVEIRSKFGPIFNGDADFVAGFQVFFRPPLN